MSASVDELVERARVIRAKVDAIERKKRRLEDTLNEVQWDIRRRGPKKEIALGQLQEQAAWVPDYETRYAYGDNPCVFAEDGLCMTGVHSEEARNATYYKRALVWVPQERRLCVCCHCLDVEWQEGESHLEFLAAFLGLGLEELFEAAY